MQKGFIHIGIIALIIIVGVGVMGGSLYFKNKGSSDIVRQENQREENKETQRDRSARLFEGTEDGGVDDLIVGENIFVVGETSKDGSVIADIIRIGGFEGDIRQFANQGDGDEGGDFPRRGGGQGFNPPEGFDFEEFQNVSSEERQERFQQLREEGGFSGRDGEGRLVRRAGEGALRGEITARDDISITIKLVDGGSRFVFFSESTRIIKSVESEVIED